MLKLYQAKITDVIPELLPSPIFPLHENHLVVVKGPSYVSC